MASARAVWDEIRRELVTRQTAAPQIQRSIILESWQRSRDAGVNPDGPISLRRIDLDELTIRRVRCRRLLDAATSLIDDFSTSLQDRRHVLYLTDAAGIVLHSRGTDFLMQSYGLRPGFDWSERTMGTNGAGTALACNAPVAVLGPEHWLVPFRDASCLAAPIRDRAGFPVGALDLSTHVSDCRPEQLDDVISLALQIENRFLRQPAA